MEKAKIRPNTVESAQSVIQSMNIPDFSPRFIVNEWSTSAERRGEGIFGILPVKDMN